MSKVTDALYIETVVERIGECCCPGNGPPVNLGSD